MKRIKLTDKQSVIVEAIAWGYSVKMIASALNRSVYTINATLRKIYRNLEINSSTELSSYWFCANYDVPTTDRPDLFRKQAKVVQMQPIKSEILKTA